MYEEYKTGLEVISTEKSQKPWDYKFLLTQITNSNYVPLFLLYIT